MCRDNRSLAQQRGHVIGNIAAVICHVGADSSMGQKLIRCRAVNYFNLGGMREDNGFVELTRDGIVEMMNIREMYVSRRGQNTRDSFAGTRTDAGKRTG